MLHQAPNPIGSEPPTTPSFGEWLKRQRRLLDLTQEELARRVGCARVTIRKFESDEMHPSKQLAELLAQALNIPTTERATFIQFARGAQPAEMKSASRATGARPMHNLPLQPTSFIGREREIADVKRLLATTHLMTLTGSGGTGKTRLSLEVAAELLDTFNDGLWFIELAPLSDSALVPVTVTSVLGVREEPGRPPMATLLDWLRDKQLLLILDNCEHLIAACAKLVDAVLHASRETRILASSREALGIAGELVWHVPSLSAPNPNHTITAVELIPYAAARLFIDRAMFAIPTFSLTNANSPAVAEICYRLDGIPLAIELAAARMRVFSAEQIAARLDDRFRLLTGGSRTALPRYQTLQASIDWSYSLLSEPERILFRRLSVFAGGWTFDTAEGVCADDATAGLPPAQGQTQSHNFGTAPKRVEAAALGLPLRQADVLDLLTQLVEKSLVAAEEKHGEIRYRLLETIRQYAHDRLSASGEGERVRDAHLHYFVALGEMAEPKFLSAEQILWLNRLEAELDNVRVALDWSAAPGRTEFGMRLAAALHHFWYLRSHQSEGTETLQNLLMRPEATARTLTRAKALAALCELESRAGYYEHAKTVGKEALAIGQEMNDALTIIRALMFLGHANVFQGNTVEGLALLKRALDMCRILGDTVGVVWTLQVSGVGGLRSGDLGTAQSFFAEAVTVEREWGDKNSLSFTMRHWGYAYFQQHDLAGAMPKFRESLLLNVEIGDKQGVAACLGAYAAVAMADEQFERAANLFGAVETMLESIRTKLLPYDDDQFTQNVTSLRAHLDEAALKAAWALGRQMTMEQAMALALGEAKHIS